jgi:chromosome segregation ATPase
VIESTLFFALGFLCAGFLALMIAPAVWRRAVNLTQRRVEASVPLTLNEIQADKDRLRAEFAMSTRRLEMNIKSLKEKSAEQVAEISRAREELKRLTAERDEKHGASNASDAQNAELRAELRQREDELQQARARLDEAKQALEARQRELERVNGLYEEAQFSASGRQIDLVARESEIEKLTDDIGRLRREQQEFGRRLGAAEAERKAAADALAAEKKRVAELEAKLERQLSIIADRDEKLERREKELTRLRNHSKSTPESHGSRRDDALVQADAEKLRLEAQIADLAQQISALKAGAKGADVEHAAAKANEDRKRLESRLTSVTRENKRLRAELAALEHARTTSDEKRASALLREQINDLAAEVLNMTIMLGGKDSAAAKAIAKKSSDERPLDADGKVVVSLADRVRALQKAAAPRSRS